MGAKDGNVALVIFYNGGAAFDPVSAVVVGERVDLSDCRRMDMPAKHGFRPELCSVASDGLLEVADEIDGVFDPLFDVGAQ